jgi:hypothetical protein
MKSNKETKVIRSYTDADYRAMMPGTPAAVAKTLRAYHGNPEIKQKYLSRVRAHAKADEIIHGTYWEDGKGCAVGCTIHSGDHSAYEKEMGIPRVLAQLEDGIFESIPNGDSKLWPGKFLAAIKPGADLGMVWPRFAVWLLADAKWGTIQYARTDLQRKSIQAVADAYQSLIDGTAILIEWFQLRRAADDAAADDAAAAAAAADDAAADDADDAAADDADDAAADDAARKGARIAQSEKLLELLQAA